MSKEIKKSSVVIPKDMKDELKKEAIDRGLTLQQFLEQIINQREDD